MIHVSCFKCKWKFTVDEATVAEAVARGDNARHYAAECPRCRRHIKVALKSLRHNRAFQEALAAAREAAAQAAVGDPSDEQAGAAEKSGKKKRADEKTEG